MDETASKNDSVPRSETDSIPCVPIAVVIPTFRRAAELKDTLRKLDSCVPRPQTVTVHVDFGDRETENALLEEFPNVRVITSTSVQGPGGGRNKLVQQSQQELIASFDDDSWPLDPGFFGEADASLKNNPNIALIACNVLERGDPNPMTSDASSPKSVTATSGFVGCGCVFRRSAFLKTSGYLPLKNAYGMEESDLALQLYNQGESIGFSETLRVFHNCDRNRHHASMQINAAHITNTALLAYLRYPARFWPLGMAQTANRVLFSIRTGRFRGVARGVLAILPALWRNREKRDPVSDAAFRTWRTVKTS